MFLQETYPSSPPVWFAESEETSVTNAVQILSNTNGRDNHVINQVSCVTLTLTIYFYYILFLFPIHFDLSTFNEYVWIFYAIGWHIIT